MNKVFTLVQPIFEKFCQENKIHDDLKQNMHLILIKTLNKLNLVTREEFEVQKTLLANTRKKLDELIESIGQDINKKAR